MTEVMQVAIPLWIAMLIFYTRYLLNFFSPVFTISTLPFSKIQDFPYSNHTHIVSTQTTTKCISLDLIFDIFTKVRITKFNVSFILYTRNRLTVFGQKKRFSHSTFERVSYSLWFYSPCFDVSVTIVTILKKFILWSNPN